MTEPKPRSPARRKRLARRFYVAAIRTGFAIGRLRPLRSQVVLATSHSIRVSGNLACLEDELRSRHPEVSLKTSGHAVIQGFGRQLAMALRSLWQGYRLATTRVFVVDDYYFPLYVIRPRRGSTIIQVWHAAGAFKKFGYSVLDKAFGADEQFVAEYPIHSNYDVCLVSAMRFAPFYSEAFRLPLERFASRFGIPRTDLFFQDERKAAAAASIRERYGLPAGKRVVLYAPTFRGETITDARAPEDLDFGLLERELGSDHVVLLRHHPFVRARGSVVRPGFVIDVSAHPDINELMLVSDVLVTDYSSAVYEFALLGRPMAFFAPDHQAYEDERGFYFDYRSGVPGPVFETTDGLAGWLRAGAFDLDRVEAFRAAAFDVADGHSTARVVDELILPALAGLAR